LGFSIWNYVAGPTVVRRPDLLNTSPFRDINSYPAVFDVSDGAIAVVFEFKEPVRMVKGHGPGV
jgi:hypothetical protein